MLSSGQLHKWRDSSLVFQILLDVEETASYAFDDDSITPVIQPSCPRIENWGNTDPRSMQGVGDFLE